MRICHDRDVGSAPPSALAPRPSAAERERVARRLRAACGEDRLSVDTFSVRLELVFAARTRAELDGLVADLPRGSAAARALLEATAWLSAWSVRFADAWRRPRLTPLVLPHDGPAVLGRGRDCAVPLPEASVSARHALLAPRPGGWVVADLGSLNGTFVNGSRIVDEVEVRPGDELRLGAVRFRLVSEPPARS